MAKLRFIGGAAAVAQVAEGSIDSYDASTTYKITVGGVTVSTSGGGSAAAVAAALVAAANASTHPYFAAVTWAVPSGSTVRGTADTPGVPFKATLSVTGGTGTRTDFSDTTANAGEHSFKTPSNYDTGTAPTSGDTVILEDDDTDILWDLDQSSLTGIILIKKKSFTGLVGLNQSVFATSDDGQTVNETVEEYRQRYLWFADCEASVEENFGPGKPLGSERFMLQTTNASTVTVYDTCANASETDQPSVRLLFGHASSKLYVRKTSTGVGVAVDRGGETSTIGTISVLGDAKVQVGAGVTLTNWEQWYGTNLMQAAATVASVKCYGGSLQTEGDYTITDLQVGGGTVICNNAPSSGAALTDFTVSGGTLDFKQSSTPRTVTDGTVLRGTLKLSDVITQTNPISFPNGVNCAA